MATKYTRPHSEVYQLLDITQQTVGDHLAACIVGAQYDLYRFGKEDITGETYNAKEEAQTIYYDTTHDISKEYVVDLDSVTLYAEGLEAFYLDGTDKSEHSGITDDMFVSDPEDRLVIRLNSTLAEKYYLAASTEYKEATMPDKKSLLPALWGQSVLLGSTVRCSNDDEGVYDPAKCSKRIVVDLVGETIPQSAKVTRCNTVDTTGAVTNLAAADFTVNAEGYTGTGDTSYILTCETVPNEDAGNINGSKWRFDEVAGLDYSPLEFVFATGEPKAIGQLGLKIGPATSAATKIVKVGDTIEVMVNAAKESTEVFDGIRLDAAPINLEKLGADNKIKHTSIGVQADGVIDKASSSEVDGAVYEAFPDRVVVNAESYLVLVDRTPAPDKQMVPFHNGIGKLYPQFREQVIDPYDDADTITIETVADIQKHLGTIDPWNDLAYGCWRALEGAGTYNENEGRPVFALRTAGTDAEAFLAAVKKTDSNNELYSFVPLTDDVDALNNVVEFNNAMSEPDVKMWRRTIMGIDNPGQFTIATVDKYNKPLRANVFNFKGKNVLLQLTEEMVFDFKGITYHNTKIELRAGDIVQALGKQYTIHRVLSSNELLVSTEFTTVTAGSGVVISLIRAASADNAAEYVGMLAKSFNTRRASIVYCDAGTLTEDMETTIIPNKYIACEIAGISSAVPPHQSITKTEIETINKATKMYTKYTTQQLDELASQGVLLVVQDHKNTPVYIRHQLTTEMDKGNLYYEDSCTRNIDSISYNAADIIDKYIGKANVTPTALRLLKNELFSLYDGYLNNAASDLLGPQLIEFTDLTVYQDPTMLDRVICKVKLYLPLPLNYVRLYEMAYIAKVEI